MPNAIEKFTKWASQQSDVWDESPRIRVVKDKIVLVQFQGRSWVSDEEKKSGGIGEED